MNESDSIGLVGGARDGLASLAPELRALTLRVEALEEHVGLRTDMDEELPEARLESFRVRMDALERELNPHMEHAQESTETRVEALDGEPKLHLDAVEPRLDTERAGAGLPFAAVAAGVHTLEGTMRANHAQLLQQFEHLKNYNMLSERLRRLEEKASIQAAGEIV